jgi:hypothetical protein
VRWRVLDDRFREVPLSPRGSVLASLDAARAARLAIRHPAQALDRLLAVAGRGRNIGPLLMLVGSVALVTMIVFLFIYEGVTGLWLMIFSPVSVTFITIIGLAAGGVVWAIRRAKTASAMALLRRQRCAACSYDLRDTRAEHDGCRVCPECSAAWALWRLSGSPAPQPEVVVISARPASDSPDILAR